MCDEFEHIADKFLFLENLVLYETFSIMDDEKLISVGRLCVTAGIHNILSFMFDGENVEFNTISGMQLLVNIEEFLRCPSFSDEEDKELTKSVGDNWNCQFGASCNSRYCHKCRKKRS